MSAQSHIKLWTQYLSKPQDDLGGLSVCPYAARARYKILNRVKKPIKFEQDQHLLDTVDVLLYLKELRMKQSQMYDLCDQLNDVHKEYVFLADHWDTETTIKDVRTNNGLYNLILCQKRSKLENARRFLRSKNYYSYWSKKYLKDVMST
jgi:hypothetical protein